MEKNPYQSPATDAPPTLPISPRRQYIVASRWFSGALALIGGALFVIFSMVPILLIFHVPWIGWFLIALGVKSIDTKGIWLLSAVCSSSVAAFTWYLILYDGHIMLFDPTVFVIFMFLIFSALGSIALLFVKPVRWPQERIAPNGQDAV